MAIFSPDVRLLPHLPIDFQHILVKQTFSVANANPWDQKLKTPKWMKCEVVIVMGQTKYSTKFPCRLPMHCRDYRPSKASAVVRREGIKLPSRVAGFEAVFISIGIYVKGFIYLFVTYLFIYSCQLEKRLKSLITLCLSLDG